ncbi:unnamed protein product [Haemonchus placei]|uniref:Uncharacterized protein n=1 Tax=Haemonchus placei TaxID=6290 RepID=A0A0N4WP02_HAEPC|nr:unnamed protein product [Haemonchus placei]
MWLALIACGPHGPALLSVPASFEPQWNLPSEIPARRE